jgi:CheY-like chemotaxis protein
MLVADEASGRRPAVNEKRRMPTKEIRCALLADGHLSLMEGVRGLLETEFEAVVVVGDEVSLFETAGQLEVTLAIVDLSLARGNGPGLIRRIRNCFPKLKLIALSVHAEKSVELATMMREPTDLSPRDPSQRICSPLSTPCLGEAQRELPVCLRPAAGQSARSAHRGDAYSLGTPNPRTLLARANRPQSREKVSVSPQGFRRAKLVSKIPGSATGPVWRRP